MWNLAIHVLAQQGASATPGATPGIAGGATAEGSLVSTALEMLFKGGWSMVPLAICSLVAVTLVVERSIVTRRARIVPQAFLAKLQGLRTHPRQALAACASDPSPAARVIEAGLKARGEPSDVQEKRLAEAGQREVLKLRQRMRLLSVMPQVATMLGLLGTVIGMIRTFTVVAASAESLGKTERLAQGIYEAWTATAAGLIIAIPTLIAYHVIMGRIDAAASALDQTALRWFEAGPEIEPATANLEVESADSELALAKG